MSNSGEPIEYQILDGVEIVVRNISTANGYWTDIASTSILRHHITPNFEGPCENPDEFPFVIINLGSSPLSKRMQQEKEGTMTFPIVCYVYNATNPDKTLSRLLMDVERALEAQNNEGCPLINQITVPGAGLAQRLNVVAKVTDEGMLYPYGYGILRVEIDYRYYPDSQKP